MEGWELSLQGETIVLEVSDGIRTITRLLSLDEADELSVALTDLIIEADLDRCDKEDLDDEDFDEDEAA